MKKQIFVLRLGHRIFRDQRITTHCCLVARAFGAKGIFYSGEKDNKLEKSIKKVVKQWGGEFEIKYAQNWKKVIKECKKEKFSVIQLTMYGLPVQARIKELRQKRDLLIIVGGEKVPSEIYQLADYNIAVTNQPHSEVAALVIFLHEYFRGKELKKKFKNAKLRIIPQAKGKKVITK